MPADSPPSVPRAPTPPQLPCARRMGPTARTRPCVFSWPFQCSPCEPRAQRLARRWTTRVRVRTRPQDRGARPAAHRCATTHARCHWPRKGGSTRVLARGRHPLLPDRRRRPGVTIFSLPTCALRSSQVKSSQGGNRAEGILPRVPWRFQRHPQLSELPLGGARVGPLT